MIVVIIINRSRSLGMFYPGACRPSLCLGAGHSSDTGETIFDTDGLAPPVSEKKTPAHQSPRPPTEKTYLIFLNSTRANFAFDYIYRPPLPSVNQGWVGRSGYRPAALWQAPSYPCLLPSSPSKPPGRPYPPNVQPSPYPSNFLGDNNARM